MVVFSQAFRSANLTQSPLTSIESAGKSTTNFFCAASASPDRVKSLLPTIYWNDAQLRRTSSPMQAPEGNFPASGLLGIVHPPGLITAGLGGARKRASALGCRTFGDGTV